ncbi:MAG: hypothetical protein WA056_02775 [Gallionella sp.]
MMNVDGTCRAPLLARKAQYYRNIGIRAPKTLVEKPLRGKSTANKKPGRPGFLYWQRLR